jgi:hypothetical protein
MIIGVYRFLSNVNRSSVNIFITTKKISVAELSTCTTRLLWHCNIYICFESSLFSSLDACTFQTIILH